MEVITGSHLFSANVKFIKQVETNPWQSHQWWYVINTPVSCPNICSHWVNRNERKIKFTITFEMYWIFLWVEWAPDCKSSCLHHCFYNLYYNLAWRSDWSQRQDSRLLTGSIYNMEQIPLKHNRRGDKMNLCLTPVDRTWKVKWKWHVLSSVH